MKKYALEFLKRGMVACWGGPVLLAIIYGILGCCGVINSLPVFDVVKGVLTITLMAFLAAGVTVVYQIESLPLFPAILIHGVILYLDYLMIYLVNGWLKEGIMPLVIFTTIFVVGYAVVWACIYLATRSDTAQINKKLHPQG